MRVVFLGSPPFALPVFERVLASTHTVRALVTQPDRPKGRGKKIESSPLSSLADSRGIPVLQPETTKDPAFVARLRALEPDVLLVASYGEILRRDVLELAPHGALNVHASLLPRHRGASPIQAAILAGDRETGVTIQRMVLALDEGDVLLAATTEIAPGETSGELLARLAVIGGDAAVHALDQIEADRAVFTPQDPARATYAKKLAKDFGRIDWTKSADEIDRLVRACSPWPGARTRLPDGTDLGVVRARFADVDACARTLPPGTILPSKSSFVVVTGDGALELAHVKPAGKGAMDGAAFLRGARLEPGTKLGG